MDNKLVLTCTFTDNGEKTTTEVNFSKATKRDRAIVLVSTVIASLLNIPAEDVIKELMFLKLRRSMEEDMDEEK